ncbi:MAG TPA: hypothetical protein VK629_09730, partial [Steroidobacteraceae bacterium]|nr:hypothetical protein [Steroidobacteraceae bacterium]
MSINRMRIDNAFRALAVLIATFALVACDGGGYDESDEPEPRAVATAIGQEFSTDSSGMMRTTTRAGAEIVLSGKDSSKGADDRGLPIIQFRWKQLPESPPASEKVNIIYRTANTISFLAPQVETETPLRFQLTVSDARGKSASTEAQVIVKPVRDENRFLQFLGADATFSAVVTTENAISPPPGGASATALLPVKITLAKLATFIDRNGILRSDIPVGESVTQNSGWAARLGTSPACDSTSNPTLRLPIPRIDLDDKLNAGIPGLGDAKLLSDVVEASDVDGITLKIRVDLEVDPAMSGAGAVPRICVNGASASAASGAIFATEALYATSMLRDSKEAASAYYEALDRYEINAGRSAKSTMDVWLESHKFDRKIQNWNSDFHAVYTNNYDLGFGRDMYMRFGDCDSGVSAQSLVQRVRDQQPLGQQFLNQFVGQCDVAAIVVNYADVEAAAKKLNPIVAVAMEYSKGPDAGRGKRFVKFYTFAPDRRDGVYRRISSVNLDRRGEQYMPQACVVCHAGTPNTKTVYYSAAQPSQSDVDVNATFLPWDLDSLLYSDTDPGFSRDSRNAVLKAQFARHAQEAQLKGLNVSAYLTYDANHRVAGRYALADELVEKWYGGPGLPNSKFGDADIPAGWAREGSSNNPMDSEAIYRNVFARNCRMCHAMHVPAGGDPRVATFSPGSPAAIPPTGPVLRLPNAPPILNPISACSADASLNGTRVGIASQVPMGCYWQFAHAPDLVDRLSRGHMPFARRTMDRMWVDQINGQTVGQIVQSHFQTTQNATVVTPGTPKAEITTSPANVDVDGVLSLDGRSSRFAQSV